MPLPEILNSAQRQAAQHYHGPLLVVAGAGAGKTKTLVWRIHQLIERGVASSSILAITFTNKAAGEMRDRVRQLISAAHLPFVSTFHALGVYILRENARTAGTNRHFSILDKEDSLATIKEIMKASGLDSKTTEPRRILGAISRAKGAGLSLNDYAAADSRNFLAGLVTRVWRKYEEQLRRQGGFDFDDLLLKTVELLEHHPEIRQTYQDRWRYLHIDEYQDTNPVQYKMAKLLVGPQRHLCVVGDADQSIYGWRGADFRNLLRFQKDYPEATVIILEQNYRSTQTILNAANQVIAKNRERIEKNLFTKNGSGERISLISGLDENDEADGIVSRAQRLIEQGVPAEEIAVLYRTNFQSRAVEEACLYRDVPYQVLGTKFFERKEIKDVLAYLKAALNPDDLLNLKRIINVPPRGLGKATLAKFASVGIDGLPTKARGKMEELQNILADIRRAAGEIKTSALIKYIIQRSGLETWLKEEGTDEDLERLANIGELASLALKYDSETAGAGVEKLLAEAALVSDQDGLEKKQSGIKLMTVHAAKGLEFRYVFVSGLEQGLFPSQRLDEDSLRDPEEERRLFYVALTRAKEKLFLSWAETRNLFGSRHSNIPSEFFADIDERLIEAVPTIYVS